MDGAPAAHQLERSTAPTLHTARHCALLTKQLECMSLTTHHTPNIARRKPPHTTSRTTHHVPQAHPPRTAHITSHAEHCTPHTTACHRTPHTAQHRKPTHYTPHTTHYTPHVTLHTPPTPCTAHRKPQQTTALHAPHTTHHRTPHTTHQRTRHTAYPTPNSTHHTPPHTTGRTPHNANRTTHTDFEHKPVLPHLGSCSALKAVLPQCTLCGPAGEATTGGTCSTHIHPHR